MKKQSPSAIWLFNFSTGDSPFDYKKIIETLINDSLHYVKITYKNSDHFLFLKGEAVWGDFQYENELDGFPFSTIRWF